MQYELYRPMMDGRKRLVATIDGDTDHITRVTNAPLVTMQRLHTSVAPHPKPLAARPQRIRTMAEAKRAIIEELTRDVPPAPSFDAIVQKQREMGLR